MFPQADLDKNDLDPIQLAGELDEEIRAFKAKSGHVREQSIIDNTPTHPPTFRNISQTHRVSWATSVRIQEASQANEEPGITKKVDSTTKFNKAPATTRGEGSSRQTNFEELD